MATDRIQNALDRIERAAARIEREAAAPTDNRDRGALAHRHAALRAAVEIAVRQLDALIGAEAS